AETFAHRAYPGGLTYSGHPLATAAAVATINAMEDEGMVANAARIGEQVLGPGLADIASRHRCVGEVRGLGVFWAVALVADQNTREPLVALAPSTPLPTRPPGSPCPPAPAPAAAMAAVLAACKQGRLLPFANFN